MEFGASLHHLSKPLTPNPLPKMPLSKLNQLFAAGLVSLVGCVSADMPRRRNPTDAEAMRVLGLPNRYLLMDLPGGYKTTSEAYSIIKALACVREFKTQVIVHVLIGGDINDYRVYYEIPNVANQTVRESTLQDIAEEADTDLDGIVTPREAQELMRETLQTYRPRMPRRR